MEEFTDDEMYLLRTMCERIGCYNLADLGYVQLCQKCRWGSGKLADDSRIALKKRWEQHIREL